MSDRSIRVIGLYAMIAAVASLVFAPLLALSYFATSDGAKELETASGLRLGRARPRCRRRAAHVRVPRQRVRDLRTGVRVALPLRDLVRSESAVAAPTNADAARALGLAPHAARIHLVRFGSRRTLRRVDRDRVHRRHREHTLSVFRDPGAAHRLDWFDRAQHRPSQVRLSTPPHRLVTCARRTALDRRKRCARP